MMYDELRYAETASASQSSDYLRAVLTQHYAGDRGY
jgi:hypothetical protein